MPRDVGNKEVGMMLGFPEEERTKSKVGLHLKQESGTPEKRIELRTIVGPGFEIDTKPGLQRWLLITMVVIIIFLCL